MVATLDTDRIWQILDEVCDPEIPVVSLRELGILREVRDMGDGIEVVITPTYTGCPAMGQMEDDVKAALHAHGIPARVVTQLSPAWTTDWISDAAREKLRAWGIAPPGASITADGSGIIRFAPKRVATNVHLTGTTGEFGSESVPCPRCTSTNTTETSHFGSTACKALYRCLDCLEPFDYFKPY